MPSVKELLVREMENYFGADSRRIAHAHRVTGYAEQLIAPEGGTNDVVIGAAVLHDIGIPESERKYGSASGRYQEIEGPPIARDILIRLDFKPEQTDEICRIIAHHHSPGKIATQNFKILYDADWLVNLRDEFDIKDREKLANIIERVFLTESGRALARETYLTGK